MLNLPLTFFISGGIFVDSAVHDIDMVNWLVGEVPETVYATGYASHLLWQEVGDIDTSAALFTYPSGAVAMIDNCRNAPVGYDQRVEVTVPLSDWSVKVWTHRASAATLAVLLQRILWIYIVQNTPSSSGNIAASGDASGNVWNWSGPHSQATMLPLPLGVGRPLTGLASGGVTTHKSQECCIKIDIKSVSI